MTDIATTHISSEDQLYIFGLLTQNRFAVPIWPAYAWDKSPRVYGLTLGRDMVLQELNAVSDTPITERQLKTVMKTYNIQGMPAGGSGAEKALIDEFYSKRRDRRIAA